MNRILYNSIIFSALVVLFFACSDAKENQDNKVIIPVNSEIVKTVEMVKPVITSGIISASKESKLSFKIPGIIKKINVNAGQSVRANQILASLDLSEIDANLSKAMSGYEKAKRDLERIQNLHKDEVATLEQLQNTQTALDIAKSNLEIAEFNFKHSKITAPSSGTILMKSVEENELVNAGYPVIVFGSKSANWKIKASVADVEIVKISIGDSATIKFDAYPDILFNAEVTEVGESADARTGTFEVILALATSNKKLASGFIGKINIYPRKKTEVMLVPAQSLTQSNKNSGIVYVPFGSNVKQRVVKTAGVFMDMIVITEGLKSGETIITSGAEYLSEDSLIQVASVN